MEPYSDQSNTIFFYSCLLTKILNQFNIFIKMSRLWIFFKEYLPAGIFLSHFSSKVGYVAYLQPISTTVSLTCAKFVLPALTSISTTAAGKKLNDPA